MWAAGEASGDAVTLRPQGGLRAICDADAVENVRQVSLDRLLADVQLARDALVRQPLRHESKDLAFSFGQVVGRPLLGPRGKHRGRGLGCERASPRAAARTPARSSCGSASF